MTNGAGKSQQEASAWAGVAIDSNVHLVPAGSPKGHEINHAPVTEQSHEYVIRKKPEGSIG